MEHEVVRSTNVFLIAYVLVFALSILLISFDGLDMVTNFTGVSAALNNIGPGLELVGPTQNFSIFLQWCKAGAYFLICLPEDWNYSQCYCCCKGNMEEVLK